MLEIPNIKYLRRILLGTYKTAISIGVVIHLVYIAGKVGTSSFKGTCNVIK